MSIGLTSLAAGGLLLLLAIACAPGGTGTPVPLSAPTAGPTARAAGASVERVSGVVAAMSRDTITLADGKTLTLNPNVSIVQVEPAIVADLQPGQYVAITAKKQQDGTLLASAINIFAESQRGLAPGQRPMTEGNLMTNATIEKVEGDTFIAAFPGGDATVKVEPTAKIQRFVPGGLEDIAVGKPISALVANGVVQSVTVQ